MGPTWEENMRTSLARAIAGTAVAAAAVLTVAGTASAATGTTSMKATTTLSIVESRSTITIGQKDVISGTLLSGITPVADKPVWLARVIDGKPFLIDAHFTGMLGRVSFTVSPEKTARYELVFHGTAELAASHSGVVTATVRKKLTTLSIVESKTSIMIGQQDTISGTLMAGKAPLAGQVVWLFRVAGGKLAGSANGHVTGKLGRVFFTVMPHTTTKYELVFFATVKLAATHSGVVTVTVTN
jgi:hypothetical protein